MSLQPSEKVAVGGIIDPDQANAGTVTTDWLDMSIYQEALALIATGVLGASATVDAKLEQAQDSSGTGAKDISNKAIAQLVKASNDDDQALINLKSNELDVDGGFTHVRLSITVGTAASYVFGAIFGLCPRFGPANDNDLDSVQEIVT